jgi:hypothetical protein
MIFDTSEKQMAGHSAKKEYNRLTNVSSESNISLKILYKET